MQLQLRLFGRIDAPSVVPAVEVAKIRSYREACIACWVNRRVMGMTQATLAELTGMRPSHISDYLCTDSQDKRGDDRREMPAKYLTAFEVAAGNTFVTQWLAMQSKLTVLESLMLHTEAKHA